MKNKTKKPMLNSEPIRNLSTALKLGSWSERDDTILLGCKSNIMAGVILQRPWKACASHRYLLVKDGRKSVKMERMGKEKATELAYAYLNKLKKDREEQQQTKKAIEEPQNNNYMTVIKNEENITHLPTIPVEDVTGLVIILNDQEMVMKTTPKKLIIKGEKLNITIE